MIRKLYRWYVNRILLNEIGGFGLVIKQNNQTVISSEFIYLIDIMKMRQTSIYQIDIVGGRIVTRLKH